MQAGGYEIDIIVTGYPGKSVCYGGLGWSSIVLLRGRGRVALVDAGPMGMRKTLIEGLAERGLKPSDVTDVILTHSHHDHAINWTMFSQARIVIGEVELAWSLKAPWGMTPVPELYMEKLNEWPTLSRARDGDEVLPGMTAHVAAGHTPGSMVFLLEGETSDVVFTGDAAKNRAELISGRTDMTYDVDLSAATLASIWRMWRRRPGSVLIPGHDLPMLQDGGATRYIGRRDAGINSWRGDDLETTTFINLELA